VDNSTTRNIRIIALIDIMLQNKKDKLIFHKQEYKRLLKNLEDEVVRERNITSTDIGNVITFLTRLESNISKCEGSIEDLEMLRNYFEIEFDPEEFFEPE